MFVLSRFMDHVKAANPQFERFFSSELHKLIQLLKNPGISPPLVIEEMAKLPKATKSKYLNALQYLQNNMPGNIPVTAVSTVAVPTDFKMIFHQYEEKESSYAGYDLKNPSLPSVPMTGFHKYFYRFKATWKSSDGNMGSLTNVYTREKVTYRQDPALPPFNYLYSQVKVQHPSLSFTQPVMGNPANGGVNIDDHSNNDPTLLACNPRKEGILIQDQSYQYCANSAKRGQEDHWLDIPNAQFLIEREVRRDGSKWIFIFRKRNAPGNSVPLFWEKKIPLGPPPARMPRKLTDIVSGF